MARSEKQKANLVQYSPTLTSSEVKEKNRKGGIRSGEVRRRKRDLKKSLTWMLSLALSKEEETQLNQVLGSKESMTQADAVAFAVLSKARKGEPQQLRLLSELIGALADRDADKQKIDINVKVANPEISKLLEEMPGDESAK